MNDHAEFALLDDLVLGMLDHGTAARVTAHVASCATCRAEYNELRVVADVLPQALTAQPPPQALRERIFAAIDAPRRERRAVPVSGLLAAALALALLGDALLAMRVRHTDIAVVVPPPVSPPRRDLAAEARAVRLARELAVVRAQADAERARERELERALALARSAPPRRVIVLVTPPPAATARQTPAPAGSPPRTSDPELVTALRTGKVYAIDGSVGGEPWHLTIVQPAGGSHALVYSGTPSAPNGETYRTWVVRDRRTVSIGELAPGEPATLEMPMALQAGDIVAFSREPLGAGSAPTSPFLMQLKIPQ